MHQLSAGRVQTAIEAYATAFESIPRALAENSGYNPIDKLVELKNAHSKGKKNAGLNVYNGAIVDMLAEGVIEPLDIKTPVHPERFRDCSHAHPR